MSQKKEKYARYIERGLSSLEERISGFEAVQAEQMGLIRSVLRERTAAEETSARRIHRMTRQAAEVERKADLWRCLALGAVLALLVVCLAAILLEPSGAAADVEAAASVQEADEIPISHVQVLPEVDPLAEEPDVRVIRDCVVSFYCCERYPHICGTGDGITATGTEAQPWVSCAVDPSVIPLGSAVTVDFGDGKTVECTAEDVGAWVRGDHVDICVAGHQEALELGIRRAEVRWEAVQ